MRAWQVHQYGEPLEVLRLVEKKVPEPGHGEIRIRVAAASLGLPDVFLCRGVYPTFQPQPPFTPGQEVTGIVAAAGEETHIPIGSRVMAVTAFPGGHGGFADQTLAYDDAAYRVPDEMSDVEAAAFLIQFQTAYIALARRGQLRLGETLLVHGGAGGVGSAAIQLGVALGARVIATAGGPVKTETCRHLGAEVAIDYREEDFPRAVNQATGGRGADVIYDPVGGEVFTRSLECIASEGRMLIIGFASGRFSDASSLDVVLKNYSVVGVFAGAYDRKFLTQAHEELLKLYAQGRIRPLIGRRVSFEEIPRALADLANRQVVGRVVADLGGDRDQDSAIALNSGCA